MPRIPILLPVLVVILVSLLVPSRARHPAAQDASPLAGEPSAVGSWRVIVGDAAGVAHLALVTFAADGTMTVSEPPVIPAPSGAPFQQIQFSGGNGVWARTGERSAALTFDLLAADEADTPLGAFTIRGTLDLTGQGERFEGVYDVVLTDPAGQVSPAGGGTISGTRILLEPMATPAA